VIELTRAQARQFLVRRHFLDPPRALPATHDAVMSVVTSFGSLQFDPLETPGVRNHDLVLHARIRDYRPGLVRELLYPLAHEGRRLFEAYNKSLNVLPLEELPWHRFAWKRAERGRAGALLAKHKALARSITARLRSEGPLSSSAFDKSTKVESYWGQSTSLSRHVLDALFMTGRIGISRRDGNARSYDLIERLIDPSLLKRRARDDEAIRHRLLSRHRAVGLMGERSAPELVSGLANAKERKRHLGALVAEGLLLPVRVEGLQDTRYVLDSEVRLLGGGSAPRAPSVSFIAPLDPLLWDRKLVSSLFDFTYTWEVYTPVSKRKYGYYVLPVLFGDRLVARIEPRFDRQARHLHVAGVWFEKGFDRDEPGFTRAMDDAIQAHGRLVEAERITAWARSDPSEHPRSRATGARVRARVKRRP